MTNLLVLMLLVAPKGAPDAGLPPLGEALPLALLVKTPEELSYKAMTERQYLLVTLLVGAKAAWDRGDFATAATKWEAVLRLPELPADVRQAAESFGKVARERAGGQASSLPALPASPSDREPTVTIMPMEPEPPRPSSVTVTGVVSGGGSHGPGGAVVVLRRVGGATPKPRASRVRAVVQKDKRFMPHVLAVPLGATVEFRNEDDFFHNVFSISKPNDFDLGLYKSGALREQVFSTPGPVHLLCNIHASMNGWLYVSDSPWFAQADATGRFTVKNVPPGQWEVEVWHEWASQSLKQVVTVASGMAELALTIDGDRRAPAFVPDKSGKPRQPQLGY
jgi:plastocyanin